MKAVQVLERVKAKAKAQVLEKVDKEKALQPLGKVERVALVAVAKAKVKENPLEAVKDKALAKVQVLEKEVKVNLADRAKALEAVKVQAKAKEAVVERVKAKALEVAKAVKVENLVLEKVRAKANPLAKAEKLVEREDNPLKVKHPKITLLTLWKISLAICHKLNKKKNKNRLVMLLGTKPRKITISNLIHGHKNVVTFPI